MSNSSHRKTINKIRIQGTNYSIPISFKNTYSSISEKERHVKMIGTMNKIRHMIMFDQENETKILNDFLNNNDIYDPYTNDHFLLKLSKSIKAIKDGSCLNPNKTLRENILMILDNPLMNNHQTYISPLAFLSRNHSNMSNKSRNKKYMLLPTITKQDPYSIISLDKQRTHLTSQDDKSIVKRDEELEQELSLYRLKSQRNKKEINQIFSKTPHGIKKTIKNQLYITVDQSRNEVKLSSSPSTSIITQRNKLVDPALKKSMSHQTIKVKAMITRLSNSKFNSKYNEFNEMKKNMKLTEYIVLEQGKKQNALKTCIRTYDMSRELLV